ncbi:MAG: hypothetical protein PHF86_05690 [Candidatus Nanoarchaeia archaeon]|nr:hypothetical protein [Candidatus Nanoarchaeia archaeon]
MKKILVLLLTVLLIAGCQSQGIKKITTNPDKYLGKEVVIDGEVNNRFIKSGDQFISVVDQTGYILAKSKFSLELHKNVTVTGVLSYDKTNGYYIISREIRVK